MSTASEPLGAGRGRVSRKGLPFLARLTGPLRYTVPAFQSPFASPPGVGLSSSMVNVLWGLFNLAVGYLLVCRVGDFNLRKTPHVLVLGAGILLMSLMLAYQLGRFHGGL